MPNIASTAASPSAVISASNEPSDRCQNDLGEMKYFTEKIIPWLSPYREPSSADRYSKDDEPKMVVFRDPERTGSAGDRHFQAVRAECRSTLIAIAPPIDKALSAFRCQAHHIKLKSVGEFGAIELSKVLRLAAVVEAFLKARHCRPRLPRNDGSH